MQRQAICRCAKTTRIPFAIAFPLSPLQAFGETEDGPIQDLGPRRVMRNNLVAILQEPGTPQWLHLLTSGVSGCRCSLSFDR